LPLTAREGIQDANAVADAMIFERRQDYDDWLARLAAFPEYVDQTIALMRQGIRERRVHAKVVMQRVPAQSERQLVDDPTQSLFSTPFRKTATPAPAVEAPALRQRACTEIARGVVPASRRMLEFFVDEYFPACSDDVGVWQFADGE